MESNILCAHLNCITYWLNVFVLIISLLFPCINVLFMISDGTCINFTTYIGTEKKFTFSFGSNGPSGFITSSGTFCHPLRSLSLQGII